MNCRHATRMPTSDLHGTSADPAPPDGPTRMHGLPQKTPLREPEAVTPKDIDVQHRQGLARLQTISSLRSDGRRVRRKRTTHRHRPSRRARRSVPRGGRALLRVVPSARHLHPVTILGDPANRLPVPNTTGTAANLRSIAVEPHRRPPCIWLVVERVSANCRRSLRQRRTFRSERT